MSRSSQAEQRRVIFGGHVQGVGFRYTTRQIAAGLAVSGFVRNLADGRVELVAEGAAAELDQLLATIDQRLGGHINDRTVDVRPRTGQFEDFEIRH